MTEHASRWIVCPHCQGHSGYLERQCCTCLFRSLPASAEDLHCGCPESERFEKVVVDEDYCGSWKPGE